VCQCPYHTDSASLVVSLAVQAELKIFYDRDMPPPGGFEGIQYKRNLPIRGPGGVAILCGVTAVCAYGFYRVGKGNLEKRFVNPERGINAAEVVWRKSAGGRQTCLPAQW